MSQQRQEEIEQQRTLLTSYRSTLAHYLRQYAQVGSMGAPPSLVHGIKEARQNITRIKAILRSWKVSVDNHPDDLEDSGISPQTVATSNTEIIRSNSMNIANNIQRMIKDFTCGFCQSQVGYDIIFADYSVRTHYYGDITDSIAIAVIRCRHCQMYNLLNFAVIEEDRISARDEEELQELLATNPHIISASIDPDWVTSLKFVGQYPFAKSFPQDIPQDIVITITEAANCLSVKAINATAVMCRRVVEKLAETLGIETKRPLHQILLQLRQNGSIDETLFDALMEVRYWGNKSAHIASSEGYELGLDEAQEMLDLVVHAVEYAYAKSRIENRTKRMQQRRNNELSP